MSRYTDREHERNERNERNERDRGTLNNEGDSHNAGEQDEIGIDLDYVEKDLIVHNGEWKPYSDPDTGAVFW